MRFKDKVVVVTGGASGIGRATALAFAREGARVAVIDKDAAGEDTLGQIRKDGGHGQFLMCDVSRASDVAHVMKRVGKLDYAFNNAGIEGASATTAEYTEADWDAVIATNLKGVWLCMKHELEVVKKGAAIVNCASIAGLVGFSKEPAYVAAKHGIVGLTRAAALEVGEQGIRVNCVCPGAVDTPMLHRSTPKDELKEYVDQTPLKRIAKPEEIAEAVLWLCSDAAAFVTGVALAVDGGFVAQ